jgi:hypothetical protein
VQRYRAAPRLTSWLFVAALLIKSAVPMLASAAAGLQGRATAEVCDVYGVDTSMLGARSLAAGADHSEHAHQADHRYHEGQASTTHQAHGAEHAQGAEHVHGVEHVHGAEQVHATEHAHHAPHGENVDATTSAERAPAHGPASRVSHGGDHCALSALAFALASEAPAITARPSTVAPMPAAGATAAPILDPAARWAAQLQHAPPASS